MKRLLYKTEIIMNWEKLRLFYQVCQDLNISKAAERLNISPSALSRHISNFEKRANIILFTRTKSGLALTKAGRELYEITEKMAHEAAKISQLLKTKDEDSVRVLRLETSVTLATMWLPHYIPGFMLRYPEIKLSIKGRDEEIDFTKHALDVAISTSLPPTDTLIQNYLMTFHLGLYASPDYLEKFGIPKRLEDLKKHQMISHDKNTIHQFGKEINKILQSQFETNSLTEPALEMNMGASLVTVASKGLGIISVSKEYPGLQQSGLIQVLPEIENEVDIYYIFQEHMKKNKKILALENYLKKTLRAHRTRNK